MIPKADFIAFPFAFLMLIDQFRYGWKVTPKQTQGHIFSKKKIPYLVFLNSTGEG